MKASNSRFWKTRDGRKVRITRMDSDHLLNAHRFLREHLVAIDDPVAALFQHGFVLTALTVEIRKRGLVPLKERPTRVTERREALKSLVEQFEESIALTMNAHDGELF
jgi:hypothetical protein